MQSDTLTLTFAALADPTRRAILARLADGQASVGELAAPFKLTERAISKHVAVLEKAGLISKERDAQRRPCRLETERLKAVAEWVEDYRRLWERNLDSLGDYLKTMPHKSPDKGKSK